MASGSIPLLEASKYGDDMLKKGFVVTIVQESPILEALPFLTIAGNALKHQAEDTLPTVGFRDVNENWSRTYGTDTEHFWGVAIMGAEVFIDNYLLKVTSNKMNLKARQYGKVARAMALTFDRYFFDGTGASKDFKGVNALITEGFGQTINADPASANGLQIGQNGTAANWGKFLAQLDAAHDLLRTGTADAAYLNRTTRRAITRAARESVTGVSLIDVGTDAFGRQVMQWNGVPLRIIGDDETGSQILGFDETAGANNDCASMYFCRLGDDYVTGLLGMGGSMEVRDFGETEASPGHLGRVEWYPGLAVFSKYGVVRVTGIRN